MSLLANYEGLRHQIERLVRENEELKKLVRLIRENHELKSAIKTQAGGLGISGFSTGFGQMAATPQHQGNCVFLPPSPAAAHEPVLEEVGVVALAPLADMLNSPQPGPTAGPIVSPLTGPLSTLLPSPGPMSQSGLSMGTVSTGTLGSSMGLPSTGPPTPSSPLAGSPLMAPTTGTVAISLSSPLLTSTAAPLGVSQNLVANPVSNLVLPGAQRVRLTEPFRGCPSGPHPSAGAGPAGTTKVPMSAEHPQPTQDLEPLGVTFVGVPLHTSTPMETKGAAGPGTAFSFSTWEARAQPGAPQGQAVPAPAPVPSFPGALPPLTELMPTPPTSPPLLVPSRVTEVAQGRQVPEPPSSWWPHDQGAQARAHSSTFLARHPLSLRPVRDTASLNPSDHKLDEELCQTLTQRYVSIMNRLQSLGYDGRVHPALTEQLVNAYGILRERPELAASEGGSYTVDFLQRVLVETVHPSMLTDALLLLSCLNQLAHDDGKPMFIW
uniref:Spermatosis and centriole associated 1 n=1 Tax=Panthera tigris altaica TaxID=74533 RepID=A0A8C9KNP6_PANTA